MSANWPLRLLAATSIVAMVVVSAARIALGTAGGSSMPLFILVAAAYVMAGALIVERRTGNAVGPILMAMGLLIVAYAMADLYIRQPAAPAATSYVAWAVSLLDAPLFFMVALLFLLFPDGRLPSPRWRWVVVGAVACMGIAVAGTAVLPGPFAFYPEFTNPFGSRGSVLAEIATTFYLLSIAFVVVAASSLIGRWRRGGPTERAQLKWVSASAALIAAVMTGYAIVFGPGTFNDIADLAVAIALGFFPIAIGIAILRYRLFEIDRLVSRTISYVVVTALLVGTYAAVILMLQGPLGAIVGGDTVSVALSTLAAAALFQPLRSRVQSGVDRRFDRARFDGERTTAEFADRLRHEVDIEALSRDLDTTVRASVKPNRLDLWLRSETGR